MTARVPETTMTNFETIWTGLASARGLMQMSWATREKSAMLSADLVG